EISRRSESSVAVASARGVRAHHTRRRPCGQTGDSGARSRAPSSISSSVTDEPTSTGGITMLKRVVLVIGVLGALGGWLGTGALTAAGAPKAYVGLFKDDAVAVIDTVQKKVLATIPVPKGPHGLVMTPDGRKVYVSSDGATTVSVIDTASDRVVSSIDVGANPHGLAISGDGSRVLVSGWGSNQAQVIDTATDRVIGNVPVAQPHNGTLSRNGRMGWVASQ